MRQVLQGFLSALVVLFLVGGASAETTNAVTDNPRETKQTPTEAQENMIETGAGDQKSIEAQGPTNRQPVGINEEGEGTQQESVGTNPNRTDTRQEPVGFIDQLKEGAKGEVDLRSKDINEKIDRFGQE